MKKKLKQLLLQNSILPYLFLFTYLISSFIDAGLPFRYYNGLKYTTVQIVRADNNEIQFDIFDRCNQTTEKFKNTTGIIQRLGSCATSLNIYQYVDKIELNVEITAFGDRTAWVYNHDTGYYEPGIIYIEQAYAWTETYQPASSYKLVLEK